MTANDNHAPPRSRKVIDGAMLLVGRAIMVAPIVLLVMYGW